MLNTEEHYKKQIHLKQLISEKHEIPFTPIEHIQYLQMAIMVELGELANETRVFKYWSTDREPRKIKVKEEFADVYTFALEIGLYMDISKNTRFTIRKTDDSVMDAFKRVYKIANENINESWNLRECQNYFNRLMTSVLRIASVVGISEEELDKEFYKKNKINIERQLNNY